MKEATTEQREVFEHRMNIIIITRICLIFSWFVGNILFAKYSSLFGKYGGEFFVGSIIAYFAVDLTVWAIFSRCPACGKAFSYASPQKKRRTLFSWLPSFCESCETRYEDDEDDAANKEAEEDKWV
jgi:hypothetical protein